MRRRPSRTLNGSTIDSPNVRNSCASLIELNKRSSRRLLEQALSRSRSILHQKNPSEKPSNRDVIDVCNDQTYEELLQRFNSQKERMQESPKKGDVIKCRDSCIILEEEYCEDIPCNEDNQQVLSSQRNKERVMCTKTCDDNGNYIKETFVERTICTKEGFLLKTKHILEKCTTECENRNSIRNKNNHATDNEIDANAKSIRRSKSRLGEKNFARPSYLANKKNRDHIDELNNNQKTQHHLSSNSRDRISNFARPSYLANARNRDRIDELNNNQKTQHRLSSSSRDRISNFARPSYLASARNRDRIDELNNNQKTQHRLSSNSRDRISNFARPSYLTNTKNRDRIYELNNNQETQHHLSSNSKDRISNSEDTPVSTRKSLTMRKPRNGSDEVRFDSETPKDSKNKQGSSHFAPKIGRRSLRYCQEQICCQPMAQDCCCCPMSQYQNCCNAHSTCCSCSCCCSQRVCPRYFCEYEDCCCFPPSTFRSFTEPQQDDSEVQRTPTAFAARKKKLLRKRKKTKKISQPSANASSTTEKRRNTLISDAETLSTDTEADEIYTTGAENNTKQNSRSRNEKRNNELVSYDEKLSTDTEAYGINKTRAENNTKQNSRSRNEKRNNELVSYDEKLSTDTEAYGINKMRTENNTKQNSRSRNEKRNNKLLSDVETSSTDTDADTSSNMTAEDSTKKNSRPRRTVMVPLVYFQPNQDGSQSIRCCENQPRLIPMSLRCCRLSDEIEDEDCLEDLEGKSQDKRQIRRYTSGDAKPLLSSPLKALKLSCSKQSCSNDMSILYGSESNLSNRQKSQTSFLENEKENPSSDSSEYGSFSQSSSLEGEEQSKNSSQEENSEALCLKAGEQSNMSSSPSMESVERISCKIESALKNRLSKLNLLTEILLKFSNLGQIRSQSCCCTEACHSDSKPIDCMKKSSEIFFLPEVRESENLTRRDSFKKSSTNIQRSTRKSFEEENFTESAQSGRLSINADNNASSSAKLKLLTEILLIDNARQTRHQSGCCIRKRKTKADSEYKPKRNDYTKVESESGSEERDSEHLIWVNSFKQSHTDIQINRKKSSAEEILKRSEHYKFPFGKQYEKNQGGIKEEDAISNPSDTVNSIIQSEKYENVVQCREDRKDEDEVSFEPNIFKQSSKTVANITSTREPTKRNPGNENDEQRKKDINQDIIEEDEAAEEFSSESNNSVNSNSESENSEEIITNDNDECKNEICEKSTQTNSSSMLRFASTSSLGSNNQQILSPTQNSSSSFYLIAIRKFRTTDQDQ